MISHTWAHLRVGRAMEDMSFPHKISAYLKTK